jgi:hypothetical protein
MDKLCFIINIDLPIFTVTLKYISLQQLSSVLTNLVAQPTNLFLLSNKFTQLANNTAFILSKDNLYKGSHNQVR